MRVKAPTIGVLGMGRRIVSIAMRVAAMVNSLPPTRLYRSRISAGGMSLFTRTMASSGDPLVTSIVLSSEGSSTATMPGCSTPE